MASVIATATTTIYLRASKTIVATMADQSNGRAGGYVNETTLIEIMAMLPRKKAVMSINTAMPKKRPIRYVERLTGRLNTLKV